MSGDRITTDPDYRTALHLELEKGKLALSEGRYVEAAQHFEAGAEPGVDKDAEKGLIEARFYHGLVRARGLVGGDGETPEQSFASGVREMVEACYQRLDSDLLKSLRDVLEQGIAKGFVVRKQDAQGLKIGLNDISMLLHVGLFSSDADTVKNRLGTLHWALGKYFDSEGK